jgi:hypothetical protein
MAVFHCLSQRLRRKILGALPGIKLSAAKVHGIGAALYRRAQSLHGPCRGKKFQHNLSLREIGVDIITKHYNTKMPPVLPRRQKIHKKFPSALCNAEGKKSAYL